MKFALLILLISFQALAELNHETHDFSFEYGLAYHTLNATQKVNNTEGRLSSDQNPYWLAAYTYRIGVNFGIRFFGGVHLVRFNEPAFGTIKNENQVLNQFGLELIAKTSLFAKWGFFLMKQDHPLYYAKTTTDFEVEKKEFIQSGLHYTLGQRRRIGLIWGLGVKGYTIFPTKGGSIETEAGVGMEGHAQLGWVDWYGNIYQLKGFYQATTAPNSEVNFSHQVLGYCLQVNHTF